MKRALLFGSAILAVIALNTGCATSKTTQQTDSWDTSYGGADKSFDTGLLELRAQIAPKFKAFEFHDTVTGRTLAYNLFIPEDYDENLNYPLVLFLHDASCVGKGVEAPLMQGYGAIIWATDESQSENPSFVLAPAYAGPDPVTNDDWQVSGELDMTLRMLDYVTGQYSIDETRLYITGQSMGCMMAFYINANHPDLFAASMYVAGQWDASVLAPLANMKFFYIISEADPKASVGMGSLRSILEKSGAVIGEAKFSARLPDAEQEKYVLDLIHKGHSINFVRFNKGTVVPATFNPGKPDFFVEHMYSFDCAYKLSSARTWLFEQSKEFYTTE
ncbi:prolyl oligopeptidase family serine peptidase [Brucepastera parasyntrophica]|uniref:carboxylesterase family protein n=1 Tax=Brucepastera parasyntrophica TaxID=2880008 RepID=UPI00210ECBF2|nr:alpha/beta hydrolase-fold protein [Brucepastera parasyntrophica]ULQ58877.1 prolyl oligopeptidase family serine peptidase [Brucepastera parasyntrophica]